MKVYVPASSCEIFEIVRSFKSNGLLLPLGPFIENEYGAPFGWMLNSKKSPSVTVTADAPVTKLPLPFISYSVSTIEQSIGSTITSKVT